jgi:penicillin-binding protein 2
MASFDLFGNPTKPTGTTKADKGELLSYTEDTPAIEEEIDEGTNSPRRFAGLSILFTTTITVLALQAYHLQVNNATTNRALAEGNSLRLMTVPADRGLILDRNGAVIAQNTRRLALAINTQHLPKKKEERQEVYQLLQEKAGISDEGIEDIEKAWRTTPQTFSIKTNLTKEESLLYREYFDQVPGVLLQELPVRRYAELPGIGHLTGHVGRAEQELISQGIMRVGKAGLERQYDTILQGTPGYQRAEVNARGEIVRIVQDGANSEPAAGTTLKLSIDAELQKAVGEALQRELERRTRKFGPLPRLGASAVLMDPSTGAIKAMVSLPDYATVPFAEGIDRPSYQALLDNPGKPLLNRAVQGTYAPGSTIKPVLAAAGLQNGVIKADTRLYTPEAIFVGQFRFPNWTYHGATNTRKAIAESNNIFFYAVGGGWADGGIRGLGIDSMAQYYQGFGLGARSGVDLPGEAAGLVPTPEWKRATHKQSWYIGDTYHASIGQGYVLATPLQMALATAAIANGGTVWRPSLAWSTLDPKTGEETLLPRLASREKVVDAQHLQVVREGMRQTVESGSGRPLNNLRVKSAGKTGTAQFGNQGLLHAWYVGYAPHDNPTLAFAILIEGGGESYYSSVPVAEEILRAAFNEPLEPGQRLFSNTNLPPDIFGGQP